MESTRNEEGFTLLNQLFVLAVLLLCIPLQTVIYKTLTEVTYYEQISIQQFFHYIQMDVNQATTYQSDGNKIILTLPNEDIVTFEAYGALIRRQVNHQGHEIYLRDIQQFQVLPLPYGLKIKIQSLEGEHYEKVIAFYD
ncbi:competence type IV pilus minor pilin ComGF [Ornithinibacillus californiensis]|uniref:competence type IV pilus minor pilin ComGF n=1 Tax=Ornithinibacillus californiensis TaxID=161536 RepID=UPI00069E01C6|nr:ComGF family competence protein [Ornithinibacillus californiensis]